MAKTPTDIRSKARSHTDAAVRVLVEIMNDRSAPYGARVDAATQIINRGYGPLVGAQRFVPEQKQYYVYSIHGADGALLYVGKGTGRRHEQSARRLNGRSRIRAEFDDEQEALAFERRLIERFNPPGNIIFRVVA